MKRILREQGRQEDCTDISINELKRKTMNNLFKTLVIVLIVTGVIMAIWNKIIWPDSIYNPVNSEYVKEVAFNLDIPPYRVTQKQFNQRYGK